MPLLKNLTNSKPRMYLTEEDDNQRKLNAKDRDRKEREYFERQKKKREEARRLAMERAKKLKEEREARERAAREQAAKAKAEAARKKAAEPQSSKTAKERDAEERKFFENKNTITPIKAMHRAGKQSADREDYTPPNDPEYRDDLPSVSHELPSIIKPGQSRENEYTDVGTGDYRHSKETKNLSNHTLKALPGDYELEEPYHTETDFNPFDGVTWIVGAGANAVPFAGASGDVDILFDSKGKVAVVESGAGEYGVPAAGGALRFGVSTADDYRDLLGEFWHAGASVGEGLALGGELSGGKTDGKTKNLTLTLQPGAGLSALPAEGHIGYGAAEPIWEGTKEEFWEKADEEFKKLVEYTTENFGNEPAWDPSYYFNMP